MTRFEISDLVSTLRSGAEAAAEKLDETGQRIAGLIRNYPLESALIVMDIASLTVIGMRAYYGLYAVPDGALQRLLLGDAFPHLLLGIAPFASVYYAARRLGVSRIPSHIAGAATNFPVIYREYIQNAADTPRDLMQTGAGVVLGFLASILIVENYIRSRY